MYYHSYQNRDETSLTPQTTNYRGITLMDVPSKVLCKILNERLFKVLNLYGTEYQFGGTPEIGCREAAFTLKP